MSSIFGSFGLNRMKKPALIFLLLFAPAFSVLADNPEPGTQGAVQIIRIDGAIGPVTAEFVENGFETARSLGAPLIVLGMDTPGGLTESTRSIIKSILQSPVPVATFVYPSGARAASAGTYILYASHIAAMAPGTNLGAATPIQIGGGGMPLPGGKKEPGSDEENGASDEAAPGSALQNKIVNDAVASIRSLAEMRGRNADWAEKSVREGASLSVNRALEENVIDVVASDMQELLRKIDGRRVAAGGREIALNTSGLETRTIEPDWRVKLLSILTNPNIAFILMLIGVYGLIFEFANPGGIGPGVVGVVCLLLGLYALNVLPLNYAGLGLLLFSIALMVAEAFAPSFGILGIGGLVAFVIASTMLFDRDIPGFGISWPVIFIAATVTGMFMIFILGYALKARRLPVTTGMEGWIGKEGVVLDWARWNGHVRVGGERWKATGDENFAPGERVVIRDHREGLVLVVEKKKT